MDRLIRRRPAIAICRRYGVLWAYGHEGEGVRAIGETTVYLWGTQRTIGFHFCPHCGCVAYWRGQVTDAAGRQHMAVNLRLGEPDEVSAIAIRHFDGLDTFEDLPGRGPNA
ncbi:MAG: hypothetical protein R3C97_10815 [Geminicoccaceae bacterium]